MRRKRFLEEEETVEKDKMVSSSLPKAKASIMDRLGPRSKDSSDHSDTESEKKNKRKQNYRDEPRLSSRNGKATASVAPCKRLEARVRPLSVVERTDEEILPERSMSSVISRDSDNESGSQPSIASRVEQTSSRRGRNRAANTNLIMKAVADAHKSVTTSAAKRSASSDDESPAPKADRKKT